MFPSNRATICCTSRAVSSTMKPFPPRPHTRRPFRPRRPLARGCGPASHRSLGGDLLVGPDLPVRRLVHLLVSGLWIEALSLHPLEQRPRRVPPEFVGSCRFEIAREIESHRLLA